MATKEQLAFVDEIAPIIAKYAKERGYRYPSAIICQAIHETGYNKSSLSKYFHNYFGLKCGSSWKGSSVNMKTQEEYKAGVLTTIKDNFRTYPNMEEGVKGYFDFISTKRYANLKAAASSLDYLKKIAADGYATGSNYANNAYRYYSLHGLSKYDDGEYFPCEEYKAAYYPKWSSTGKSIVNGLLAVGESDTSFKHRKEIYKKNFGGDYTGTAEQNLKMVMYLQSGMLYKV